MNRGRVALTVCLAAWLYLVASPAVASAGRHPQAQAGAVAIQPGATQLTWDVGNSSQSLEAETTLRISLGDLRVGPPRTILLFAALPDEEAMRAGGGLTIKGVDLRVRNEHQVWTPLAPLPELNGRLGVHIGTLTGGQAVFRLQVQLHLPPGQRPGDYHGLLMIEALEE